MAKDAAPSVSAVSVPTAAYPMPSVALPTPVMQKAAALAPAPAPSPKEYVVVPPRGTLAAGRWEAKPSTIWIVVAMGALVVLGWALFRVRRAAAAKRRQLETLVTLKRP